MKVKVAGVTTTIRALQHSTVTVRDAAQHAVEAGGEVLLAKSRANVSLRDHTLAQLAALDHPYARRHGSIRIHANRPWLVHSHSGRLLQSTYGRPVRGTGTVATSYEVGFDLSIAPHARYITMGTRVMLPRDPLWAAATDPKTRKEIMKAIVRRLGPDLRSKLGLRFGSGSIRSVKGVRIR